MMHSSLAYNLIRQYSTVLKWKHLLYFKCFHKGIVLSNYSCYSPEYSELKENCILNETTDMSNAFKPSVIVKKCLMKIALHVRKTKSAN